MTHRTFILYLCALLSPLLHQSAYAENTDVIVFDNGDQITGEYKSMKRGKRFKLGFINLFRIDPIL